MTNYRSKSTLAFAAMVALPVLAWAGAAEKAMAAEPASKPSITGNLSLNLDSHFVSFGQDVWGGGSGFKHLLFHPSLELNKAITNDLKLIVGTWWDVNDRGRSTIGNRIQEVDVWLGASYTTGIVTTTALYQQWMFPDATGTGRNEQALELKIGVDTFLKPTLLIHERLPTFYDEGTVVVLSAAYDFKAGPVNVSVPAAIEYETKGYHGGTKAGIGYGSLGLSGSVPVDFISKDATFSVGITGYSTNKDCITDAKKSFLTYSTGISIPF
jgi:hypothetical protein